MKLKFIILIILIFILFLNYLQNQELFFETTSTVRSLLENKIDDMIGDSHLTTPKHQSKLKKYEGLLESVKTRTTDEKPTSYYSLSRDKILITLFYDPQNKFSRDFYDDTEITPTDFEKLEESAASSIVSISDGTTKPWNLLKNKIKENNAADNQEKNPYLSEKLIHIEEIPCSSSRMEECHLKDSILEKNTNPGAPGISKASQPPRSKNLVNKLPKIISSFYVPIDSENSEHIMVEYDGDYTLFNENNPVNLINIIKYMKDSFDKHLEIKDIDTEEEIENDELRKMVHHLKHKHQVQDYSLPDFHSSTIINSFHLLNEKKSVLPPIYNNSFIYKCKLCPQFVKSQIKL